MNDNSKTLFPVIMKVPDAERLPRGKEQVRTLSRLARQAARISAEKSGLALSGFPKNENGVPIPAQGLHWSISHKTDYVSGVVSTEPVGIDIERMREVSSAIMEYIADDREWDRIGGKAPVAFFRFWTAKEAVLKAMGVGFTGLSHCRIIRVVDDDCLIAGYDECEFIVYQTWFTNSHIAAITGNNRSIQWTFV
jgi:4'-phosphopantetheinyl transferase